MSETKQEFRLATHAFIEKGDKFLVTHRSPKEDFMPNCWDIPGGSVDFGEDPIKGVARETKEETGLNVVVKDLIYCHNQVYYGREHWFALTYRCDIVGDESITLDQNEHDDFRWVTRQEIQSLPNKIDFLEDFSQNYLSK
jgi:8-oxo-dGTP pyrophosphatase MutT (NUDIX family)